MTDLLFQMLRNGIEELRAEKYQQEKNGQAEALQITLNNLQEEVKKLNIDDVSNCLHENQVMRQGDGDVYHQCLDCCELLE